MHFKKWFLLLLLLFILVPFYDTQDNKVTDSTCNIPYLSSFSEQEFPKSLPKERLRALLQITVDAIYFKGFRYLGDPRDFFHGHILSYSRDSRPFAILYHTQEAAYALHREQPGSQFDYLDTQTRNWIQWIDSGVVENANRYERTAYPDSTEYWRSFPKYSLPRFKKHFTIFADMLDPMLIGGELTDFSTQWSFVDVTDQNIPKPCISRDSNLISIRLPTGELKQLMLLNSSNSFKYERHGLRKMTN